MSAGLVVPVVPNFPCSISGRFSHNHFKVVFSEHRCVFVPNDFMFDQAKEIAATTLESLKKHTSCYSACWSIDGCELHREEVG